MENKDIAFTIMDGSGADANIEIARSTARLYASRFFFFFTLSRSRYGIAY